MKDNYKNIYFDNLYKLSYLYMKVRDAIILAENFDIKREMYVAPINQLRSALDHVFKAISCAQDDERNSTYELKEAKEHLNRAGCNALELLIGSLGKGIIEKLSKYETSTLSAVFPEYYKDIKPELSNIRKTIAVQRLEKESDTDKLFLIYFDQITKMIKMNKEIDAKIPSLEKHEYERKKLQQQDKKSNITQTIIAIVSGLVVGIVISLLYLK